MHARYKPGAGHSTGALFGDSCILQLEGMCVPAKSKYSMLERFHTCRTGRVLTAEQVCMTERAETTSESRVLKESECQISVRT